MRRIVAALGGGPCFVALISPTVEKQCHSIVYFNCLCKRYYNGTARNIKRWVDLFYFEEILNEVNMFPSYVSQTIVYHGVRTVNVQKKEAASSLNV